MGASQPERASAAIPTTRATFTLDDDRAAYTEKFEKVDPFWTDAESWGDE